MRIAETNKPTARQAAFAQAYVRCMNATQAATEAGYSQPSKSGPPLVHHPVVAAEIERLRRKVERQAVKPGEVIETLVALMRTNISDVLEWGVDEVEQAHKDGSTTVIPQPWVRPVNSIELSSEAKAAIAEVSLSDKGTFKLKMHDKGAAIDKLMRHLGLYERDNEQKTDALTDLIAAVQGNRTPIRDAENVTKIDGDDE